MIDIDNEHLKKLQDLKSKIKFYDSVEVGYESVKDKLKEQEKIYKDYCHSLGISQSVGDKLAWWAFVHRDFL